MSELGPSRLGFSSVASETAERHIPDRERGGCTCGFCAWSEDHLAQMVAGAIERFLDRAAFEASLGEGGKP